MMVGTTAGVTAPASAVAAAAVYLESDEAEFVHAATLDVDGGRVGAAGVAGGGFSSPPPERAPPWSRGALPASRPGRGRSSCRASRSSAANVPLTGADLRLRPRAV